MSKEVFIDKSHRLFKKGLKYYENNQLAKAYNCFLKSAKMGHIDSQYFLGEFYYYGLLGVTDYPQAMHWYAQAANQGHIEAAEKLADYYYDRQDTKEDREEAFKWLQLGIKLNSLLCLYLLALSYHHGFVTEKDSDLALKWYKKTITKAKNKKNNKSAKNIIGMAMTGLGFLYETSFYDDEEAEYWYIQGSNNGSAESMMNLATLYQRLGEKQKAIKYYKMVIDNTTAKDGDIHFEAGYHLGALTGNLSDMFLGWK